MIYLSQLLDIPIIDSEGAAVGRVSDLAVATGDVFPRVTALAYQQEEGDTVLIPWKPYVAQATDDQITLTVAAPSIEPTWLKDNELFLARDVLDKQIVDVAGKKVVTVNDLQLADAVGALRLTAAEVSFGAKLRRRSAAAEKLLGGLLRLFGSDFKTNLIAWNYIDLPGRDLSQVKLSISHKRLHELHPADVADIIEQLAPEARAAVFAHLDNEQAAETISEMEDEFQADVIDDLSERHASDLLAEMGPDDAADIIADLDRDKAERLLRLMGYEDSEAIRQLLGYGDESAGGIMTSDVACITETATVGEATAYLQSIAEKYEDLHYLYLVNDSDELVGAVGLLDLLVTPDEKPLLELALPDELFVVAPDDDQEDVAKLLARYNLLAVPVVDEQRHLLGMVTIDDAVDVLVEEAQEDLEFATGTPERSASAAQPSLWRRVVDKLRWIAPRHVIWLLIWLVMLIVSRLFSNLVSAALNSQSVQTTVSLYGAAGLSTLLITSLYVAYIFNILALLLPIPLLTIQHVYLRATEILIDYEPSARPRKAKRFFRACCVAVGATVVMTALSFVMLFLQGVPYIVSMLIVVAVIELLTTVIAALIIVAFINHTVARDDQSQDITPLRSANWAMLIFTVLLLIFTTLLPWVGLIAHVLPAV